MGVMTVTRSYQQIITLTTVGSSTTTFDPANSYTPANGGNQTLSNGNLTVTGTGVGIARTVANYATGKYYCEFTCGQVGNAGVGLMTSLQLMSSYMSGNLDSIAVGYGGAWQGGNASGTTTAPLLAAGKTYGLAFDATARLVWLKNITDAGDWNDNGSSDPATGSLGCSFNSGIMATGVVYVGCTCANSGDNMTFNFGATAYAGTAPSGFSNL